MKKYFLSSTLLIAVLLVFISFQAKAQVTIGANTTPDPASVLDIISTNKGVSFPQMSLTSTTTKPSGTTPKNGTVIYNTNGSITGATANGVGLYVWITSQWVWLKTFGGTTADSAWVVGGNSNGALKTLGTNDNFDLPFEINNTERMRLTTNGFLGIATNTPTTAIQLVNNNVNDQTDDIRITTYSGTFTPALIEERARGTLASPSNLNFNDQLGSMQSFGRVNGSFQALSNIYSLYTGDGTTLRSRLVFATSGPSGQNADRMIIDSVGNVFPAADNAQSLGKLTNRWSTVFAASGTINTSDIRLKANITPLNYGLKEVLQIDPIIYSWKNDNSSKMKLGLSAQQLQSVLPEVVVEGDDADKTLGVYYSDIIPVLINAIKEQQVQIEELKARVKALEKKKN